MVPLREHRPRTGLEAKFSAEFAMASALVAGRVGMGELTNEFVNQSAVQALFPKVRVTPVDEADPEDPLFAPSDRVRVRLNDGATLEGESIRYALGHARNPIGLDELHAKFRDCVGNALPPDASARLFERLSRLEAQASAAGLYAR
jgi:2-methylcitrate dehydratase PrpD